MSESEPTGRGAAFDGSPRAGARGRASVLGVACLAVLGCLAWAWHERRSRAEGLPDVILVTVDTTRADHCSVYGYPRPTTPFLESLAEDGALFRRAVSPSSWTAPSMASLFTGLVPREHGVVDGVSLGKDTIGQQVLVDDFTTLAEVFARHGYATAAVTTNAHLAKATGFSQGFHAFRESFWESSPAVEDFVADLVPELDPDRPLFLWLHWVDPHSPYEARGSWLSTAPWREEPSLAPTVEAPDEGQLDLQELRARIRRYDSEIRAFDESLERVLELLDLPDDAIIAVTSDHGESFAEHGEMAHATSLYAEQTHVPLVLVAPGRIEEGAVDAPVSMSDLYAWLPELALGVDPPPDVPSIHAVLDGADPGPVLMELERGRLERRALLDGPWKLRTSGSPESLEVLGLHDLESDPFERRDASSSRPELLERMLDELGSILSTHESFEAPYASGVSTQEAIQQLRDLGYGGD